MTAFINHHSKQNTPTINRYTIMSSKSADSKDASKSSHEHSEKPLRTMYRSYISQIIVASRTVDKISQSSDQEAKKEAELKKAVTAVISTASKIKRKATTLEEKLCGNAKELEALHFFHRSQPTWYDTGRKRKYASVNNNPE